MKPEIGKEKIAHCTVDSVKKENSRKIDSLPSFVSHIQKVKLQFSVAFSAAAKFQLPKIELNN